MTIERQATILILGLIIVIMSGAVLKPWLPRCEDIVAGICVR